MCREAKKMITHCETENALWQKTWTWSIMLCSTTHTWWIYLLDVGKVDKNDKTYARKCTTYINLSCLFQLQKNIQRTNMQRTLCEKTIAKTLHRKALANPKLIERNITEKKKQHTFLEYTTMQNSSQTSLHPLCYSKTTCRKSSQLFYAASISFKLQLSQ